jgi:DNA repair exonuclease SbcCD ATPase subunit
MQSQDERDASGFAARIARDGTVRVSADEEITGRYEGEELEERRAARPPDERFSRLENKHDELKRDVEKRHDELKRDVKEVREELKDDVKDVRKDVKELSGQVGNLRKDVGGAVGKLEGQEKVLGEMLGLVKKAAEREHVTFTAKVDVEKANELAKVEVTKAEGLAKVEVSKEQGLDTVAAKKVRRDTLAKIVGGVVGGGGLVEMLHRLGVL